MPEGNPEGYIDDDIRRPTQDQLNAIVRDRTKAGAKTEGKKKKDKKNGKKNKKGKDTSREDSQSFRGDYKPVE